MRFATYERAGAQRAGVVDLGAAADGGTVAALPPGLTVRGLIEEGGLRDAGSAALAAGGERVALAEVRLLPPLRPASIRDFVAFEAHIEGVVRAQEGLAGVPAAWYEAPAFYFTNPHACVGAHDDVAMFAGSVEFDFEIEVGAVVGKAGRDLAPEHAWACIEGFTIFNDWSARDLQRREGRLPFGFAKGKDGAHTLGPVLVTADELEPYRTADGFLDLTMTVELDGEVLAEDSLASMAWPFEELIAYASRGTWVMPGDVLASGTCGGGCLAELWGRRGAKEPAPLRPGSLVTLSVEGIGTISNRVVPAVRPVPLPPARSRERGPRHRATP